MRLVVETVKINAKEKERVNDSIISLTHTTKLCTQKLQEKGEKLKEKALMVDEPLFQESALVFEII